MLHKLANGKQHLHLIRADTVAARNAVVIILIIVTVTVVVMGRGQRIHPLLCGNNAAVQSNK